MCLVLPSVQAEGEQSRVTVMVMKLVCVCSTQASVKTADAIMLRFLTCCTLRCDVTEGCKIPGVFKTGNFPWELTGICGN